MSAAPVDADRFKAAFRHHAAGVAVVTAMVEDGPVALTASSVTSVSAEPPVLLFSVSAATRSGRALARAGTAVIHLLDAEDLELAMRCADPATDRFADTQGWTSLATGEPVFLGPRVLLRGHVQQRIVSGQATVLMLAIDEIIDRRPGTPADSPGPLAYHDRSWHVLGPGSRVDGGSE